MFTGNNDVVFMGLTPEGADAIPQGEQFLKSNGVPWVSGYGAEGMIQALEVKAFPTEIVFGKDGKVVWHSFMNGDVETAISNAVSAS